MYESSGYGTVEKDKGTMFSRLWVEREENVEAQTAVTSLKRRKRDFMDVKILESTNYITRTQPLIW